MMLLPGLCGNICLLSAEQIPYAHFLRVKYRSKVSIHGVTAVGDMHRSGDS